jgi:predicted enzyme related to lactoylglutathione lyase
MDNLQDVCKRIVQLGGSKVNDPITASNGKVRVAYCHDLDGILMELVEELEHHG